MPTSEATKIAVLQEHQDQMTKDIAEIKADIREIKNLITTNFVTQAEYISYKARTDNEIKIAKQNVDAALLSAKKTATLKSIGYIIITAAITALVYYFFNTKVAK
jgi:t-SNARE complex subunit (syntaxin)